jgi:PAS domain S-box-containing protein
MDAPYAATRPPAPVPVPEASPWALVFIVLAIMALAGVPIYTSRLIASEEVRISEVLEPAQRYAAELALVQARQMLRFREYLLTGDTDAKVRYQALLPEEAALREDLFALLDRMDEATRLRALPLGDASLEWHLGHRIALDGDPARLDFLALAGEDQTRYELMLLNSLSFREGINEEMEAGRRAAADARRLQLRLTIALLALTLLATVAVALVGRRLRGIISEANLRRRDAVRARWEIDAILEATGDGVLGIDLDGQLLTLNATGARMLGFLEEEARGRSVHDLLHGAAQPDHRHAPEACPLLNALRAEAPAERVDDVLWHRRGSAVPVRWALRPLMDGRVVRGAVVTVTDMTQIREAERALREAVRARDETMAVVSHDLRNPLGSIMAASELLLEVPLNEDKTRRQLRTIQKAAERSNLLIDDLLDVARIDAGVLAVRPTACAVRPLLDEAASLIAPQSLEKEIEVLVRVPGDVLLVHADRNRMLQVLGNLLGNALRHTSQGGEIRLAAGRRGDDHVVISVTDTGQGITPEDQERLFDRFWRRDRTARSGAGLGLAIVKGIVEAHSGRVEVQSEVGQGSTFSVVLPAHPRALSPSSATPDPAIESVASRFAKIDD